VAAVELTVAGAGQQLPLLQPAVVVAARALSRELTAGSINAAQPPGSEAPTDPPAEEPSPGG